MPILLIISILCPLIPLLVGIKERRTLLWLYVMTGFISDLIVVFLKRGLHVKHHPATNLYVLIEFLLIAFFYRQKLFKHSKYFPYIIASFCIFFVANTLSKTIFDLNAFGASLFSLCYIIFSMAGFYSILKDQKELFLERSSFFWANIAFLLYASGNLLLFLFKDYLRQNNDHLFIVLWQSFFLMLNISRNIILTLALSSKTSNK